MSFTVYLDLTEAFDAVIEYVNNCGIIQLRDSGY